MIVSALMTLALSAVLNAQACTIAFGCGSCYISGSAGHVVRSGKYQDCVPCETIAHGTLLADHDGLPEPRKGTHRLMAYTPPNNGGPSTGGTSQGQTTGGSGTRNS